MRQPVITLNEAARYVNSFYQYRVIHPKTLQNAARLGKLIAFKKGKDWYTKVAHLKLFLKQRGIAI